MNTVKPQEKNYTERSYNADTIAAFRKTAELFGGLSNMAPGFPIKVNGIEILTTEALYQACRYPHMPEVQERILKERSPMTAKMVGKPFRSQSRSDFELVKVDIMRWCLRIKLAQNFFSFGKLLESTGTLPIVENSHKDPFWGAVPNKLEPKTLKGVNALGRLLMELRQQYNDQRYSRKIFEIEPLRIPNFKLLGFDINTVDERANFLDYITSALYVNKGNSDISRNVNNSINSGMDNGLLLEGKVPEVNKKVSTKSANKLAKASTTNKRVKPSALPPENSTKETKRRGKVPKATPLFNI